MRQYRLMLSHSLHVGLSSAQILPLLLHLPDRRIDIRCHDQFFALYAHVWCLMHERRLLFQLASGKLIGGRQALFGCQDGVWPMARQSFLLLILSVLAVYCAALFTIKLLRKDRGFTAEAHPTPREDRISRVLGRTHNLLLDNWILFHKRFSLHLRLIFRVIK